jgi:hypothetical protein
MKIVTYLVGRETDIVDANGKKVLLVYAKKLTRGQAEPIMRANPGTEIFKHTVHSDGYEVCNRLQTA